MGPNDPPTNREKEKKIEQALAMFSGSSPSTPHKERELKEKKIEQALEAFAGSVPSTTNHTNMTNMTNTPNSPNGKPPPPPPRPSNFVSTPVLSQSPLPPPLSSVGFSSSTPLSNSGLSSSPSTPRSSPRSSSLPSSPSPASPASSLPPIPTFTPQQFNRLKLKAVLDDQVLNTLFRNYLSVTNQSENLAFWEETRIFRKQEQERQHMFIRVYDLFLADSSGQKLFMTGEEKEAILPTLEQIQKDDGNVVVDENIFLTIEGRVWGEMSGALRTYRAEGKLASDLKDAEEKRRLEEERRRAQEKKKDKMAKVPSFLSKDKALTPKRPTSGKSHTEIKLKKGGEGEGTKKKEEKEKQPKSKKMKRPNPKSSRPEGFFSASQVKTLQKSYTKSSSPSFFELSAIVSSLGLEDSLFHKILVEEWFCNQREGAGKTKEKKGGKKVDKKGGGGGGGGGAGEYLEGILAPGQIAALKECLRGQKEWSEERITEIWKELEQDKEKSLSRNMIQLWYHTTTTSSSHPLPSSPLSLTSSRHSGGDGDDDSASTFSSSSHAAPPSPRYGGGEEGGVFSLFSFPDLEILEFYFLYHTEDPDDDDINQIQMEIQDFQGDESQLNQSIREWFSLKRAKKEGDQKEEEGEEGEEGGEGGEGGEVGGEEGEKGKEEAKGKEVKEAKEEGGKGMGEEALYHFEVFQRKKFNTVTSVVYVTKLSLFLPGYSHPLPFQRISNIEFDSPKIIITSLNDKKITLKCVEEGGGEGGEGGGEGGEGEGGKSVKESYEVLLKVWDMCLWDYHLKVIEESVDSEALQIALVWLGNRVRRKWREEKQKRESAEGKGKRKWVEKRGDRGDKGAGVGGGVGGGGEEMVVSLPQVEVALFLMKTEPAPYNEAAASILTYCFLCNYHRSVILERGSSTLLSFFIKLAVGGWAQFHERISAEDLIFEDLIGKGAAGTVHRAEWNNTEYAVKCPYDDLKEFSSEVAIMSILSHPNVVSCEAASLSPSKPLMVVRLFTRGSLGSLLFDEDQEEKLTRKQQISMALDVARGMSYLHSFSIIHRDLKPDNILVDENYCVAITDFGVSRMQAENKMTKGVGSSIYIAPEVFFTDDYTNKVDVYAFSYCLFALWERKQAFDEIPPFQVIDKIVKTNLRPNIDSESPFATLMPQCWNADPTPRPAFTEIMTILEEME